VSLPVFLHQAFTLFDPLTFPRALGIRYCPCGLTLDLANPIDRVTVRTASMTMVPTLSPPTTPYLK
jgi:hypothetical protein